MGRDRPRKPWRLPVLATVLITACLVPTDEGDGFGELRVRPTFEAGAEPDATGATIDSIRTIVRRNESDEPVIDQVRPYNGPSDDLTWLIEMRGSSEDMDVSLELRDGTRTLYQGARMVPVESGKLQQPVDDIAVTYMGPPPADRVEISPARTVFNRIGASSQLTATVYDASGAIIDGYDLEWSTVDTNVAVVDGGGEVVSIGTGSTYVVAAGATAVDTASILVDEELTASSTITANPSSMTANGEAASLITVEVRDAEGELVGASAGTVVLTSAPGDLASLGAVTDHEDGTYTATLTVGMTPGTVTVTGTLDGAAIEDSAEVELTAGEPDPTTTTITADPVSIPSDGASTSEVTVEVRDASGNVVGASAGTVELSVAPEDLASLGAVTDQDNGTYTATLTAGTTAGTVTVTATLAGAAIEDFAEVELTAGEADPTTTTITADPVSIPADGASTSEVTVEVRDATGNAVGESAGTVVLDLAPGDLGSLGPVTDHENGTYTATLTAGTTAGTVTVTATLDGAAIDDAAEVQLTAGEADPTATTITATPTSITADGSATSEVLVEVRDANDNLVGASAGTVALDLAPGDLGSLGPVTDHENGTYTATLTAGTTAGTVTVTGTLDGAAIDDSAEVELTAGEPDPTTTSINADPVSILADGASTSEVTVEVRDASGNVLGGSAGTVELSVAPEDLASLGAVTDHENGTYTATLTAGTTAGTARITGTLNGAAIDDAADVQLTAGEPDPTTTTISTNPNSIAADGSATSEVLVEVRDANGNLVGASAGTVVLDLAPGDLGSLGSVTDHENGTYTATLMAGTTAGTVTITGTLDGAAIDDVAEVQLTADPVDVAFATITADPTEVAANRDDPSIITVRLFDENEEPITESGGEVELFTTLGTLEPVIDHENGTYTAELRSGETGTALVTGTLNYEDIDDSAEVVFVDDPVDVAFATITADPTEVEANGDDPSIITVRLFDENEDPITESGGEVELFTTLGTLESVIDHENGTYTAELRSGETGTALVTGTLNYEDIDDPAWVEFTPGDGDATTTTITASPDSIPADGSAISEVLVEVRDANGNPVGASAGTVTLASADPATGEGLVLAVASADPASLGPVTDHGDGTYTAILTAGTTVETVTITGTLNGVDIEDTAEVEVTAGEPDLQKSTIAADSAAINADGVATTLITVQLLDSRGRPTGRSGGVVTLSSSLGTVGPVTDHGDGTYTATLTAGTTPGEATVTGALDDDALSDSAVVKFRSDWGGP